MNFNNKKYATIVLFILIILIGVFLRLYKLDRSLSGDEFFIIDIIRAANFSTAFTLILQDVHPPLYFLLEYFFLQCLVENEINIRILSVLFSVLALISNFVVLFIIHLKEKRTIHWLLGLFLIILSQPLIAFSQEARPYSLLYLCTSLLFLALVVKYYYQRNSYSINLILSLFCTLTHYYGLFFVYAWAISDILISLINSKPKVFFIQKLKLRLMVPPMVTAAVCSCLILGYFLLSFYVPDGLTSVLKNESVFSLIWSFPKWYVFNLVGHFYFNIKGTLPTRNLEIVDILNNKIIILPILTLAIFMLYKFILIIKTLKSSPIHIVLIIYGFFPFILAYIASFTGFLPYFREKYLIGTILPFILMFFYLTIRNKSSFDTIFALLLLLLNLFANYNYYFKANYIGRWENWKDATRYLEKQVDPEKDIVVWYAYYSEPETHLYNYYANKILKHRSIYGQNSLSADSLGFLANEAKVLKSTLFFVYYDNHRVLLDVDSKALDLLEKNYSFQNKSYFGPRLIIYKYLNYD
ncbi:MAG: hypothetical protein GX451_01615 [Acholeplasmataceae bacterium]|nr:hypothetical protein [Acholeplasmataceae bacterium]